MKKYHFIAIGGIGMSGLAKYLLENGYEVSGSDVCDSKYITKLRELGAKVYIGHDENNLPDDCIVVASTAIKEDNPEMQKAKRLGLTIYHRSDVLKVLSEQGKFFLGYAGTHGKTTTSGLSSYVLEKAGLKPSYVVGGILPDINTNAHCQDGKYFCAELDESDGTVVKYRPNVVVINNLEADHLDFYKNGLDSIIETFGKFLSTLKNGAIVLANNDNDGVKKLIATYNTDACKIYTYALNSEAYYLEKNVEYGEDYTTYDVYYENEFLAKMRICLKGVHNIYNSLAVFASLHQAGVDINLVLPYFAEFTGMGRRFQKVCEFDGITVYDDYAHHPTEIKAALSSALSFKNRNVIAVFQPHRYSRLQSLWNDFKGAFDGVSRVVVTDVYAASEKPIEGVTSENFVKGTNFEYISGGMDEVAKKLLPTLKSGDIVIGLGAGTITNLGKELLKGLEKVGA